MSSILRILYKKYEITILFKTLQKQKNAAPLSSESGAAQYLFRLYGYYASSLLRIACKNSREESFFGVTPSALNSETRSPVISPSSMVRTVASSSFFANAESSGMPSSSPRFASAPVQAKIVATELVEVSSPLRCL